MATCEVCGNDYYLSFEVITSGVRHVFDSFECAIHKLAPICHHCGCKIIGHGIAAIVTLNNPGKCTLVAQQPGDATFSPATPVTQTFNVSVTLFLPLVVR